MTDLTGKIFGEWTVIGFYGRNNKSDYLWLCRCSCGNEKMVSVKNLRQGSSTRCIKCASAIKSANMRGVRKVNIDEYDDKLKQVRSGAGVRGLDFTLSREQFIELSSKPCYYCKVKRKHPEGIDRFDNSKGYIPGNCVTCCWICNRAKGELTPSEWESYLTDIINARRKLMSKRMFFLLVLVVALLILVPGLASTVLQIMTDVIVWLYTHLHISLENGHGA